MIGVQPLFEKIAARRFDAADARELIKTSYYFAGAHPDVHIILSVRRPADFHFQHVPRYEERAMHSMFESMDVAAAAIAAGLNCAAGAAALRFLSVNGVNRVVLYSRSGARRAETTQVRVAVASMGARSGTMYGRERTEVVVMVLTINGGQVVLTTAYPTHHLPADRPQPPADSDLLEYGDQRFVYAAT